MVSIQNLSVLGAAEGDGYLAIIRARLVLNTQDIGRIHSILKCRYLPWSCYPGGLIS